MNARNTSHLSGTQVATAVMPAAEPRRASSRLGLVAIMGLVAVLGFVLQQKFSGNSNAWADWDYSSGNRTSVGQEPTKTDAALPAWARDVAEEKTDHPHQGGLKSPLTAPESNQHSTQLAQHAADDPFAAPIQSAPPTNLQPVPKTMPGGERFSRSAAAANHPQAMSRELKPAETPRSLFAGPDDHHEPQTGAVHAVNHAPQGNLEVPSSESGAAYDPFAPKVMPNRAPNGQQVHTADHLQTVPKAPGLTLPAPGEHGGHLPVPETAIRQTSGIEHPRENGFPEPEPFDLKPSSPPAMAPHHPLPSAHPLAEQVELHPHEASTPHAPPAHPTMTLDPLPPSNPLHHPHPAEHEPAPFAAPQPTPAHAPPARMMAEPSLETIPSHVSNGHVMPIRSEQSLPVPAAATAVKEEVYEVQPGDNYWTISRQFYGTARFFGALAEYNKHRIPQPERMKPGMFVLVPDVSVLHDRYPKMTGGGPQAEPAAEDLPGFFVNEQGQPCYRVDKGDTLTDIAQRHLGRSSRWMQVYGMNKDRIPDPNALKIGTVLRLPGDACQVVLAPGDAVVR